jgi:hypothetical protein
MGRLVLALIRAAAASGVLHAHHSYAGFYDPKDRTMLLEGTLERILYGNPHVILTIRTGGSRLYTVTWQSSQWVKRQANVEAETFKAGDRLVIIGAPSRDADAREVTQVREVRRPSDGWVWKSGAPFAPPS